MLTESQQPNGPNGSVGAATCSEPSAADNKGVPPTPRGQFEKGSCLGLLAADAPVQILFRTSVDFPALLLKTRRGAMARTKRYAVRLRLAA